MVRRFRVTLSLLLLAALPFHAFLVTVLTRVLRGEHRAPLPALALWKEALLGIIVLLALLEIFRAPRKNVFTLDRIDLCIAGLFTLGVVTSVLWSPPTLAAYGFKYTLFPLLVFSVLRRVDWPPDFLARASSFLIIIALGIAAYGILTLVLPQAFFTRLGYSDLHSLYLPDAPLAAFQYIGDLNMRRVQSVMSGPNQLGLWLLIPWSIGILRLRGASHRGDRRREAFFGAFVALIGVALLLTFSRSAWIAAGLILVAVFLLYHPDNKLASPVPHKGVLAVLGVFCALFLFLFILVPDSIIRINSTREHAVRSVHALTHMIRHPLGSGLGAAGPAHHRVSDACVFLPPDADASWAADRPDLCVFAGDAQMQPLDRACQCAFLPENWYLQVGVELGWIGMALFLTLVFFLLTAMPKHAFVTYALLGVAIAGLFLHSFEDSAVAYSLWLLAAVATPMVRRS